MNPSKTTTPIDPNPAPLRVGLIIIGDEILSGKRADKHLPKFIEILAARGLQLAWTEYLGDDPVRITESLQRAFASGDIVFSCGGIGATPDDHTRQCAAAALGVPLALHPEAQVLIEQRMRELAEERGEAYDPTRPDNVHRFNMGVFPTGARIIPNPYNRIPGFSYDSPVAGGAVHFLPGFPVMAWPMMAWVLDQQYAHCFNRAPQTEQSVVVYGAIEATLTPLMQQLEAQPPRIRVFSLPSVDHPVHGRHIELGVKGPADAVPAAWTDLLAGLHQFGANFGP